MKYKTFESEQVSDLMVYFNLLITGINESVKYWSMEYYNFIWSY